jgi:uncharacterized protein YlaN (UPF0358 family)
MYGGFMMTRTAAIALKQHKDACEKMLKDIKVELKKLTNTKNPDWGHVGSTAEITLNLSRALGYLTNQDSEVVLERLGGIPCK